METPLSLEDIIRVPIRFSEVDSMGVVWHGAYVALLEDGRESFGRHFPGIGYADIAASGIYAPVHDLRLRYVASLHMNDVARVHTTYEYHPGARLDFAYRIFNDRTGELCLKAHSTQLFITPEGELSDIPPYYAEWQRRYVPHLLEEA